MMEGEQGARRPSPPAGNRTLSLEELEDPRFAERLERLERLTEREDVSYLHPGKRWEYPWALERARLERGSRVLDAGCGDSVLPVFLAERGHEVVGLDLELSGTLGRLHRVPIRYVRGNLTSLPLAGGAFDAVFCISVIEHLTERRIPVALAELRRVVRPGGRLLLTTDYYSDADAEIWYEGPKRRFRVNWSVFDERRLRRLVLRAPGWALDGDLDLEVDWDEVRPRMRAYHGYPYTSVGVALTRT